MRKTTFSEEQIALALRDAEEGTPVTEVCRKMGLSEQSFYRTGRVAPGWNLGTLHEDMKWSAGAGVRSMVNHVVLRVDLAASSEDVIVQLFIGHPF